ncbi:MAG TPA: T9SS type A sorting domain-containing protein, partial [Paludibacter sp.]
NVSGHQWGSPGTNSDHALTTTELVNMYSSLADQVTYYKTYWNLNAAIYTQLTDVETEINGLLTYDRIPKVNVNLFRAINERIINQNVISTVDVVPSSQKTAQTWKYTTTQPVSTWANTSFDDSAWKSGQGGFGTAGTPGGTIRTTWATTDIWMRQQFTLSDCKRDELPKLALNLHHDEDCDVYINGVLAGSFNGYTSAYELDYIKKEARNVLIIGGKNTIAIHCTQKGGGQFIDAGIVKTINTNDTTLAYSPKPLSGTTNQATELKLQWRPGNMATSHKVYLGTNALLPDSTLNSTQTDTTLIVSNLKEGKTYYWRVDEVTNNNVKTGYLWNFTTKTSTGINNPTIKLSKIYPNPLKKGELLQLDLGANADKFDTVGIWSVNGILLLQQPINGMQKLNLNLQAHNLAPGVYFVRAEKTEHSVPHKNWCIFCNFRNRTNQ